MDNTQPNEVMQVGDTACKLAPAMPRGPRYCLPASDARNSLLTSS